MRDAEKEKYWLGMIEQWEASGLSHADFCRREGMRDKQFYYWRRELKKRKLLAGSTANTEARASRKSKGQAVKFIPVAIKEEPHGVARVFGGGLEIVTPGRHAVVVDGINDAGNIVIRDPAGTAYEMTPKDFHKVWTGIAVHKKR